MMAYITFLSFLLFSMCHSIHVAVNTWINCSFFTLITYRTCSYGLVRFLEGVLMRGIGLVTVGMVAGYVYLTISEVL